jgi:hypothetical protein
MTQFYHGMGEETNTPRRPRRNVGRNFWRGNYVIRIGTRTWSTRRLVEPETDTDSTHLKTSFDGHKISLAVLKILFKEHKMSFAVLKISIAEHKMSSAKLKVLT